MCKVAQDANELRQQSQLVTNRAKKVLAASEAASSRLRTGSGSRARLSSAPFLKGPSRLSPADQQHIASLEAQIANLQKSVEVRQSVHSVAQCLHIPSKLSGSSLASMATAVCSPFMCQSRLHNWSLLMTYVHLPAAMPSSLHNWYLLSQKSLTMCQSSLHNEHLLMTHVHVPEHKACPS